MQQAHAPVEPFAHDPGGQGFSRPGAAARFPQEVGLGLAGEVFIPAEDVAVQLVPDAQQVHKGAPARQQVGLVVPAAQRGQRDLAGTHFLRGTLLKLDCFPAGQQRRLPLPGGPPELVEVGPEEMPGREIWAVGLQQLGLEKGEGGQQAGGYAVASRQVAGQAGVEVGVGRGVGQVGLQGGRDVAGQGLLGPVGQQKAGKGLGMKEFIFGWLAAGKLPQPDLGRDSQRGGLALQRDVDTGYCASNDVTHGRIIHFSFLPPGLAKGQQVRLSRIKRCESNGIL